MTIPSVRSGLRLDGVVAPALIFCGGWLTLYLPAYLDYAQGAWRRDENGHVLFMMAIIVGAAGARLSSGGFTLAKTRAEAIAGLALLVAGLTAFSLGRVTETELLSSGSQSAVALGAVMFMFGVSGVRRLWFPLALTFYLIIWPGWALNALTAPLKMLVSEVVANALYAFGLPVAHAGAVISAGSYQLLVADACSGLNSLIALTAVGAVYLYAAKRADWRVNAIVLLSLAPIAVIANILRVTILVLITYFLGYDAGQSYLHEGAGLVMFSAALGAVFAVDFLAALVFARDAARRRS